MHKPPTTSGTSVSPHLTISSRPQHQTWMSTPIFFFTPYTIALTHAAQQYAAHPLAYLLTVHAPQTRLHASVAQRCTIFPHRRYWFDVHTNLVLYTPHKKFLTSAIRAIYRQSLRNDACVGGSQMGVLPDCPRRKRQSLHISPPPITYRTFVGTSVERWEEEKSENEDEWGW